VGDDAAVTAVGAEVATLLGGRGGGRKGRFQGKVTRLDKRDEALALTKCKLKK